MALASTNLTFLLILGISLLTGFFFEPPPPLTKKQLLRSIDANASLASSDSFQSKSVAVGTNICVDLIVSAHEFLAAESTLPQHSEGSKDAAPDTADILSEQDLANAFAYFFARGAAAERFVEPKLFQKLVTAALAIDSTRQRLGGNAALMGNNLAKKGHSVLMSGNGASSLKGLVAEGVSFSESDAAASAETHIILEYSAGDSFQGITSDRANRLILSPAVAPSVDALQAFAKAVDAQTPAADAVVFSGLHLLESATKETWRPYLAQAKELLAKRAGNIPHHLELASLSNDALTKDIVATLFPVVTSIGLNEEELGALFFAVGGSYDDLPNKVCNPKRDAEAKRHRILRWNIIKKAIKLLSLEDMLPVVDPPDIPPCLVGKAPHVSAVTAALDYVFRAAKAQGSIVSRIHFHSLAYHIIATAKDSEGLQKWENVETAAALGAITATYQACNVTGHEDLHGDDLKMLASTRIDTDGTGESVIKIKKDDTIHTFDTDSLHHTFVPVLICKDPVITVGLGDAISSAAFAGHLA